jgi:outer membrane receptor protein involved in Fe transport
MKKFWFLHVLVALLLSLPLSGQTFRFEGKVFDQTDNKAIENVVAELSPLDVSGKSYHAITDRSGTFVLECPAGSYRLRLQVLAYTPLVKELTIGSDMQEEFQLSVQSISLGEIEVSSFRISRKVKDLPVPLALVESQSFRNQSALSLSNVLAAEPGLALGGDGVWATSINVRGMSENRLVTMIDGNRVETASDLTASMSLIDVNDVERVEVMKAAQSSLYGTGAIGGIVNIITRDGHFADQAYVSGTLLSGYASANKQKSVHAAVNTGSQKWYLRLSGSMNNADDIRTPEGVLANSQFKSNNVAAKIAVKPFANHLFKLQYQNNWATDVGIPGGAAFPGPAEARYTDIGRQLLAASYEIKDIGDRLSSLEIRYFTQYINRDVEMIPNAVSIVPLPAGEQHITPELIVPIGNHLTHGAQLQSNWDMGKHNTLIAGVDVWSRKITTERTKYITVEVLNAGGEIIKTNNLVRGETPIPEATFSSAGIFVQDETQLFDENLRLIVGGRMDLIRVQNATGYDIDYLAINGTMNNPAPNQRITFEEGDEHNISWSANTGLVQKLWADTDLSFTLSRSFRAASLEERFKYIDLGNFVRLGDPELQPESAYSADLGLRIWKTKFNLQADAFVNSISNMIVETPGEFIYTVNTGPLEGSTDTIPALINANVSKALLYGFDFGMQYNVWSRLVVSASGAYVRGLDTEAETNLPRIPPLSGRLGMRYTFPRIVSAEFTVLAASKQDKIADGETETAGYARFDLAMSSAPLKLGLTQLRIYGGIENLTDRSYTNHLSTNRGSISIEPGRNYYIRLILTF